MVKQVKNNILIGLANPFDAPKAIQVQKQTEKYNPPFLLKNVGQRMRKT